MNKHIAPLWVSIAVLLGLQAVAAFAFQHLSIQQLEGKLGTSQSPERGKGE